MKEKANWAKKIGLAKIKKLDWTFVDELVLKEMINNNNHVDQYVKLKGRLLTFFSIPIKVVQVLIFPTIGS